MLFFVNSSCKTEEKQQFNEEYIKDLIVKVKEQLVFNNYLLMQLYEDDGKTIDVSFTPQNDNVVVFKFSDKGCSTCSSVMKFLTMDKRTHKIPVEIWFQDYDVNMTRKQSKSHFLQRAISDELNGLKSNKLEKPYFFVYNKNTKEVRHIFLPETDNIENIDL